MEKRTTSESQFGNEKFLKYCANIKETDFHIEIVQPLIEALGGTHLQYTHGPNERGKDFLYMMASSYGTLELHACVVKNGEFNGRASDSNSVQTALNQIRTAKETECLNPITNSLETPKRILFIATHSLPDKHTANMGPYLSKLEDFCTFLVAVHLAQIFHKNCPKRFWEIVSPGSVIASKLLERLQLHNEASVFRLPLGQNFKTYVEMRMISQCPQMLALIHKSIRPNNVEAQYLDKRFVQYLLAYQEWMRKYVPKLSLISLTENPPAPIQTNEQVRIRFESLGIGDLFDVIYELHESSSRPKCDGNLSDVLFSLHSMLSSLLTQFSCGESKLEKTAEVFGTFGPEIDSTDTLALASDNLYIVGDPGGGKTFTSQELARRIHVSGQSVIYFPCSRINAHQSLLNAIEEYVVETSACTIDEARAYLKTCETYVIDGLDEAITLDGRLIAELQRFVDSDRPTCLVEQNPKLQLEILPESLQSKIFVSKSGSGYLVEVTSRLHWDEANLVACMLSDDKVKREDTAKALKHKRRFIVTCRQASEVDLGPNFRKVRLQQFTDTQLEAFVASHCKAASFSPDDLLKFFRTHPYIHEVCKSPLTASIMLGIYLRGSRLPQSLSDLYERRANLLLQEWDYAKKVQRATEGTESQKLRLLGRLAFDMHRRRKVESSLSEMKAIAKNEFKETLSESVLEAMIDDLIRHHGLLCRVGDFIGFGHLSHLEFFCARFIMQRQKMRILVKEFGSPRWRNVTIFFVGLTNAANELLEQVQKKGKLIADSAIVAHLIAEGNAADGFGAFLLQEIESFENEENWNETDDLEQDI